MIRLESQRPFAEGDNRLCFVDPRDPTRCLKVMKPNVLEQQFRAAHWHKKLRGRQAMDDNFREAQAYAQPAIRKGGRQVWQHLPRWYGQVETDLGLANVTQLVGREPGKPGPTLEHILKKRGLTPEVVQALEDLAGWLTRTGVLTRNLLPHNLVALEQDQCLRLFVVDGLGASFPARLMSRNSRLRYRYTQRRVQRMWLRARWEAGGRRGRWEDVEQADR